MRCSRSPRGLPGAELSLGGLHSPRGERVIATNPNRRPKRLWTEPGEGPKVELVACPDDEEEARYISIQESS